MAEMTRSTADTARGLLTAGAILSAWAVSISVLVSTPLDALPVWLLPIAILWQMFLFTGLFITAHDGMHGTIAPRYPKLNDAIGAIAVGVYAGFRFSSLRDAHRNHHAHPGTPHADPDYHDGEHTHPIAWYVTFLYRYLSWQQLVLMAIVFNVLQHGVGLAGPNLVLFWVVPSLLSTLQLFFVGTYLPHHQPVGGHTSRHNARSLALPPWLSLLACYHFGYHLEHHERPGVPWWRLPTARFNRVAHDDG